MKALDIEAIEINKDTNNYKELKRVTADIATTTTVAQSEINIQNLKDSQRINAENLEETLKIQREETQRMQRLQTEQSYIGAHALNKQAEVMNTAANSLGQMGGNIGGDNGNLNPASMMTGMMMGGALGGQMAGMITQMGQNVNQTMQQGMHCPPPIPQTVYFIYSSGQQKGPFDINALKTMIKSKEVTLETFVWKQGMPQWEAIKNTELSSLFLEQLSSGTPPPFPSQI